MLLRRPGPAAALLPALAVGVFACGGDRPSAPAAPPVRQRVAVVRPGSSHEGVGLAVADALRLLAEVSAVEAVSDVPPGGAPPDDVDLVLAIDAEGTGAGAALGPEGFALVAEGSTLRVSAPDALGLQYGIYEALERLGFLFVHPRQTVRPAALCRSCVAGLDLRVTPSFGTRGVHVHTMHPLEHEAALLEAGPENLAEAIALLDFFVTQKHDLVQWVLLDTAYLDTWLPHAAAIVAHAHARGLEVGIVAPYLFSQQNTFSLIDPATEGEPETHRAQLEASLGWLLQVPWDALGQEMGTSEFLANDDVRTVELLNQVVELATALRPAIRVHVKIHVSQEQVAPNFGGINFNFLPGVCDPRLGVLPHTVQFYDLVRPAPTYDQEDFFAMREFLLQELGERRVLYYPETSYWATFDLDVPLSLPAYSYARWLDLSRLRGTGMDGQLNFVSGYEWGAWANDRSAAHHAYFAEDDFLGSWRPICATLGAGAADGCEVVRAHVLWQDRALHEENGIRWLVAWDNADSLGHELGRHGQPVRLLLHELDALDGAALDAFERDELPGLGALEGPARAHAAALRELASRAPAEAFALWDELALGAEVLAERVAFVRATYEAAVARRRHLLGGEADPGPSLRAARAAMGRALALVRLQEGNYRYPLEQLALDRPSYTIYPFGLYRPVHDLYYWDRELAWATDPATYDLFEGLYDPLGYGERPPPP